MARVRKRWFIVVALVVIAAGAVAYASINKGNGNGEAAEAEPAFMSWTAGPLGRAGRGLFAIGWSFRRLTTDDLVASARHEALWAARSGWAIGARNDETFEVSWLETSREDAVDMVRALVDLATASGAERIALWIPDVTWMRAAARRAFHSRADAAASADPAAAQAS